MYNKFKKASMHKGDFINHIIQEHSVTKTEAESTIDNFTSSVISALQKGNDITLIGFGTFAIIDVAERKGRNPQTGAEIIIPAHKKIKFSPGKKLKDSCNSI